MRQRRVPHRAMALGVRRNLRGAPRRGRGRGAAVAREPDRRRHRRVRLARDERRRCGAPSASSSRTVPRSSSLRVDRTDPSKNAVRGFEAFGRLLERDPALHGRVVLLALLDPSRQEIPEYVDYRDAIERAARSGQRALRAAGLAARPARRPRRLPRLGRRVHEYDVLLINPVMDGLNLVAKEAPLVNERDGVLVLSRRQERSRSSARGRSASIRSTSRTRPTRSPGRSRCRPTSGARGSRDSRPRARARPRLVGRPRARGARGAGAPLEGDRSRATMRR